MKSNAKTVTEYLKSLPTDRQKIVADIRKAIRSNLPKGFEETMGYGMIGYVVPLSLYKEGYHCNPQQPLPFISVASQKNHISVYHMGLYGELLDWLKKKWPDYSNKKLDAGKCCIRFKKPDDVPMELLAILVSKMTPQQWISQYETALNKAKNQKIKKS